MYLHQVDKADHVGLVKQNDPNEFPENHLVKLRNWCDMKLALSYLIKIIDAKILLKKKELPSLRAKIKFVILEAAHQSFHFEFIRTEMIRKKHYFDKNISLIYQ